jgi:hypothetical protein
MPETAAQNTNSKLIPHLTARITRLALRFKTLERHKSLQINRSPSLHRARASMPLSRTHVQPQFVIGAKELLLLWLAGYLARTVRSTGTR